MVFLVLLLIVLITIAAIYGAYLKIIRTKDTINDLVSNAKDLIEKNKGSV